MVREKTTTYRIRPHVHCYLQTRHMSCTPATTTRTSRSRASMMITTRSRSRSTRFRVRLSESCYLELLLTSIKASTLESPGIFKRDGVRALPSRMTLYLIPYTDLLPHRQPHYRVCFPCVHPLFPALTSIDGRPTPTSSSPPRYAAFPFFHLDQRL